MPETRCPSVFAVVPVKSRVLVGSTFELHLYCEEPGAWHPLPGQAGHYQVNEPTEWLRNIAPYLKQLLAVLKHAAPLAGPVLGMTVGTMSERLKTEVEAMTELVAQIPEPTRMADSLPKEGRPGPGPAVRATSEADFRALEALLTKLDPDRAWGGLSRTVTPEGLTLYLCSEHSTPTAGWCGCDRGGQDRAVPRHATADEKYVSFFSVLRTPRPPRLKIVRLPTRR